MIANIIIIIIIIININNAVPIAPDITGTLLEPALVLDGIIVEDVNDVCAYVLLVRKVVVDE